jgi:hypothetical protein
MNQLSIIKVRVVLWKDQDLEREVLICTIRQFLDHTIVKGFDNLLGLVPVMDLTNSDLAELKSNCGRLLQKVVLRLFQKGIIDVIYPVPNKSLIVFRDVFNLRVKMVHGSLSSQTLFRVSMQNFAEIIDFLVGKRLEVEMVEMSNSVVYLLPYIVKAFLQLSEILVSEDLSDGLEDRLERTGEARGEVG